MCIYLKRCVKLPVHFTFVKINGPEIRNRITLPKAFVSMSLNVYGWDVDCCCR